jgi:hypothetical protein
LTQYTHRRDPWTRGGASHDHTVEAVIDEHGNVKLLERFALAAC